MLPISRPKTDRQDHREQDVERAGNGGRDGDRPEHGPAPPSSVGRAEAVSRVEPASKSKLASAASAPISFGKKPSCAARRSASVTHCGPPRSTRSNVSASPPVVPIGTANSCAALASRATTASGRASSRRSGPDPRRRESQPAFGNRWTTVIVTPMLPASAISAMAISGTAVAKVVTAVTSPSSISSRTHSPSAPLDVKIDGGRQRRRGGRGKLSSQSDWPTWLSTVTDAGSTCSPSALNAIVAAFSQSSSSPTPPIAGVGRIALPPPVALLSL